MIQAYSEVEKKMHQQGQELGQLRQFAGIFGPFLESPDGQRLQWNKEALYQLAEAQGILSEHQKKLADQQKDQPPSQEQIQEINEKFMDNPTESLKALLAEHAEKTNQTVAEALKPLAQQLEQQRLTMWATELSQKYPDFNRYLTRIGELRTTHNIPLDSRDNFEKAYVFAKALSGDLVDKAQANQQLELAQKAITSFQPGISGQRVSPPGKESVDELLGLDTPDTKEARTIQEWFGKSSLKPQSR